MPSSPSTPDPPSPRKSLLIEGWRGINHSYAVVNQHQLLELLTLDRLRLFHRDMPFALPHWNRTDNADGFSPADRLRIDTIPEPGGETVDCIYRICSPFRRPNAGTKTLTFMATELGPTSQAFDGGVTDQLAEFTRGDNAIVTLSRWSRDRLVDFGFDADRITVIPLGVDTTMFRPPTTEERSAGRANLGLRDDETVFLHVGGAFRNKGVDILLRAFAVLRARGRRARLIVKDQRDVYKLSIEPILKSVAETCPALAASSTLAAISVVTRNLDRAQLRMLYAIADCYASPYRAEGFNLPVLEAIACGVAPIVTGGGATDDFCDDDVAIRIPGRSVNWRDQGARFTGRYLEPDLDALVEAMDAVVSGSAVHRARFSAARAQLLGRFTWRRAAEALARLAVGDNADAVERASADQPPPQPAVAAVRRIDQDDILNILAMIRPMAMSGPGKVRIGNGHDGGYVLPSTALGCDGVVSIGVGGDVSFDLALAERGATVLQFDNTVERPPAEHPNFHFQKLGWGATTDADMVDFKTIASRLDALAPRLALLKFDIEGAEYAALETVTAGDLTRFAVIVCEVHDLHRLIEPDFHDRVRAAFAKLTRDHAPVHLHANNYRPLVLVQGVPVPEVMEISFLRRDLDRFAGPSREPIPGPFDRPNHPNMPDICLSAFSAPADIEPTKAA